MTPLQRAALIAHSASSGYRRHVERARGLLRHHPGYAVSISWGKDSVAMLHLAAEVMGHVVAVHGRYSVNEELTDIPVVRDKMLEMLGDRVTYIEVPVRGDWEVAEIVGYPLWEADTAEHRALLREVRAELLGRVEEQVVAAGCIGSCVGLAAHESRARALNARVRGEHYQAVGRLPTLAPLQWWTPDDVLAYHVEHGLPWLHIYDVADDPRRARSEIALACGGGDAIRRHGAWDLWRRAYPDLCARWESRWPGMLR